MHKHTCIHAYIHTYSHTYIISGTHHAHIQYIHTYIHTFQCRHAPRDIHQHHAHIQYIHTYIHTFQCRHAPRDIHQHHAHIQYIRTYIHFNAGMRHVTYTNIMHKYTIHTYIHTYIHTLQCRHAPRDIHQHHDRGCSCSFRIQGINVNVQCLVRHSRSTVRKS